MRHLLVLYKLICLPAGKKRTKQVFGQIYLSVETHFHKTFNFHGENPTKSQQEAQCLPASVTREVEQKMHDGSSSKYKNQGQMN